MGVSKRDIDIIVEAAAAWEQQNYDLFYELLTKGLALNYKNYELYLMMGQYYECFNPNQAYLCFRQALYYCKEKEDRIIVEQFIQNLLKMSKITVQKTAIILLSYNNCVLTKECIQSIRENISTEFYELVVVDNASEDGIVDWLKQQKDITLILNQNNNGFPMGCNQGINAADKKSDVFLLNNDTILSPNSFFWLQMGLYENGIVGAVGSVSNSVVNYQQVSEQFDTIDEWMNYARKNNIPNRHPYERKGWLVGFAMLIKREALEKTGYLDERFTPGNYEDNDLSIRLLLQKYQLLLCKNSFIYHYGGSGFQKAPARYQALLKINEEKLEQKYGINYIPYSRVSSDILCYIQPEQMEFSVLEIGCKLGCTLARIESRFPGAAVIGTENRKCLSSLAKQVTEVLEIDFQSSYESLKDNRYDFIILDRTLTLWPNIPDVLMKVKSLLSQNGCLIIAVDNAVFQGEMAEDVRKAGMVLEQFVLCCEQANVKIMDSSYRKGRTLEEVRNKNTVNIEDIAETYFVLAK